MTRYGRRRSGKALKLDAPGVIDAPAVSRVLGRMDACDKAIAGIVLTSIDSEEISGQILGQAPVPTGFLKVVSCPSVNRIGVHRVA